MKYPEPPRSELEENLHGISIRDPFRPLEDPHAEHTKKWVNEQIKVADAYFAPGSQREVFRDRLTSLYSLRRLFAPQEYGQYLIYEQISDGQNQGMYYRCHLDGSDQTVILDPNKLSDDGTVAVSQVTATKDCSLVAYQVRSAGSDWAEIRVRDVRTTTDLPDRLLHVKFSEIAWLKDGSGFFYTRFPKPDEKTKHEDVSKDMKLYLHVLGTAQDDDQLIFEHADPEVSPLGSVTDDGEYLVITCFRGAGSTYVVYVKSVADLNKAAIPIVDEFHSVYSFLGNRGHHFYFLTSCGAPRRQVVAIDISQDEILEKIVVPETEATLVGGLYLSGQFLLKYLRDANSELAVYGETGRLNYLVELPGIGTVTAVTARDQTAQTIYFGFESFISPLAVYAMAIDTGEIKPWRGLDAGIEQGHFSTRQVFFASKDGTRVPIFLSGRRDVLDKISPNGSHASPLLLYAYGGFNISVQPSFNFSRFTFMEQGGLYAVANIRGGNEYGEEWHASGVREKKQNVFDDFIGAAEYLITEGYTNPDKLAILGGSNGGLLVGACMTQRPELFRASIAAVGVLDMLRFHKFTVGWAWIGEYGNPEDPNDFRNLLSYSPLHNLKKGTQYPSTLITTGDHDDRVVPAHSYKFAAALQEVHHGDRPILIRIDKKAGHGVGKPTSKLIHEATDILCFLWQELQMGDNR